MDYFYDDDVALFIDDMRRVLEYDSKFVDEDLENDFLWYDDDGSEEMRKKTEEEYLLRLSRSERMTDSDWYYDDEPDGIEEY